MKLFTLIIILLISNFIILNAQTIFTPNEYLEYEVSFIGIKLGKITVTSIGTDTISSGKVCFNAKAKMDSYNGIPFLDLHAVYNSWMDRSIAFSHFFIGKVKWDEGWDYNKITFDYEKKKITNRHWLNDSMITNDVFDLTKKINDGCSLFFFARQYANMKKTVLVPTFIDGIFNTKINFRGKGEPIKIDAINYPAKTLYLDGTTDWKGIYGLTGSFEGWFTDDEARIPLKAYMNVYVGKVLIELTKWERKGWTPPKAK
ncbi:MAG: hypothetical protein A2X64_01960 [Ignavibacteria bacterium GWF2_33_9]|nr:MAG: hypothetical protein A2X64_01960 [Ignavibacteria bacterium GWF2_33_9]